MKLPYTSTSIAITGYSDSKIAKTERADCVVRAVASASGMTYDKAHKFVSETFNRVPKRGTYGFAPGMNRMALDKKKLNRKTIKPITDLKNGTSQMTVGSFVKLYDKGTYIVRVSGHAFTIKDGSVIGNIDDATRVKRIVKNVWKIGR